MVAPLVPAASSVLSSPCPTDVKLPMEKLLQTPSLLNFPNEFPYEFDSSTFSSPPGDLTETEDETTDDEDDFLAGLTRRLALSAQRLSSHSFVTGKAEFKTQVSKTQSGLGSPNGPFSQAPSPPTSPFPEEDSLKVISAAGGEVAKMKTADFDSKPTRPPNPNPVIPFPQNAAFYDHYFWLCQPQIRFQSILQQSPRTVPIAWFSSHYCAPTAVKTPSAGTGVFLPRKYTNSSDSKKKSENKFDYKTGMSGGGCVRFPKKVVHQQNPIVEELSDRCQPKSQACLSTGPNKNDPVVGGCLKQERPLPNEWIY